MSTLLTFLAAAMFSTGGYPSHVPLTPQEAADLGLDGAVDGTMYRVLDNAHEFPSAKGGIAQSLALSAHELRPSTGDTFLQETANGRWCEAGSTSSFSDISVQLPDGATMGAMRTWGFDTSGENLTVSLIERCTPNNVAGSVITSVIASITHQGNGGNFSQATAIGANNVVDTDACSYTLRARFSTPQSGVVCAGSGLRLQKVRIDFEN